MRTAIITIGHADGTGENWTETYRENDGTTRGLRPEHTDIDAWAREIVAYFNATITQPHEKPRCVIAVEVTDDGVSANSRRQHDWHKTNIITISDRLGVYDAMRCKRCGVTGKRFGVSHIKIDSKYRGKKWQYCS